MPQYGMGACVDKLNTTDDGWGQLCVDRPSEVLFWLLMAKPIKGVDDDRMMAPFLRSAVRIKFCRLCMTNWLNIRKE